MKRARAKVRTKTTKKRGQSTQKSLNDEQGSLQLGIYLQWVHTELESEASCLEMPWTLLMLFSFAALMFMHVRPDHTLTLESAWKYAIEENANFAWSQNFGHKNVYDVDSIADFWSWLRLGLLPNLLKHSWTWSEGLDSAYATNRNFSTSDLPSVLDLAYGLFPDEPWGNTSLPVRDDFHHFNRIVAGIRLQQERATGSWEACHLPPSVPEDLWKQWLGKPCMPADPNYFLHPEVQQAETFTGEPQRVEWMLSAHQSLRDVTAMTMDMEDGCAQVPAGSPWPTCKCQTCQGGAMATDGTEIAGPWIDEYTQRVEIAIMAYNQNYGLLSRISVNFFFNRGGRIHQLLDVQSGRLNNFSGNILTIGFMILCDALWIFGWMKLLMAEAKEMVNVISSSNETWWKALLWEYLAFWNIIDWLSLFCAFAVLATYIRMEVEAGSASEAMSSNLLTAGDRSAMIASSAAIFQSVESFVRAEGDFRLALLFFPLLVMLRLFKSFHAQPRLAVVTKTLSGASQDLLHFSIVLVSVYVCLAVAAVLLFGEDVEEFATLDRAAMTCFRALLGEYDWDEMASVGRVLAGIWLWFFVVIVDLLLLNMVLAILMDAYQEVKSKASVMTTVPHQISEILRRRRLEREKKCVRLSDIWYAYMEKYRTVDEMLESKQMVRPEDIVKHVPNLTVSQARRTLNHAITQNREEKGYKYGLRDVRKQLRMCNGRAKILREEVAAIRSALEEAKNASGSLPSPSHLGLKESTVRIMEILNDSVGDVRNQIEQVLDAQYHVHEIRRQQLEADQREMRVCAHDAKAKLKMMVRRMEGLSAKLDEQVTKEQVDSVFGHKKEDGLSLVSNLHRSLAILSEPTRGQVAS